MYVLPDRGGKIILINAQMNVKRRGSYLSAKKGNVLSGFLKEQVSQVRWRLMCLLKHTIKYFLHRTSVFR